MGLHCSSMVYFFQLYDLAILSSQGVGNNIAPRDIVFMLILHLPVAEMFSKDM